MTPEKARKQREKMLLSFTPGGVLMLLGEVFGEWAEDARASGSEVVSDNLKQAEATMAVVGLCLDATLPKPMVR